jgi:hypothetical protein
MCEWPLRFWWLGSHSLDGSIHRGSSDAEEFGDVSLTVGAEVVQLQQMFCLVRLQLRLLAAQPTLSLRYFHPFPGAQSDQISLELRHHRQHIEQQPPRRVGRIMDRPAKAELDVPLRQLVEDVPGVGQRPGEPVQLSDDQRVTGSAGR